MEVSYCDWCIILGRVPSFGGCVRAHSIVGLADVLRILLESATGIHFITFFKLNFEVFLKIFIPENNIVRLFRLV